MGAGCRMHLPSHARLPPGMAHQYMAAPQMWPAQAAVRLPAQQQPNLAETPQQTQHYQQRQAEQQWPTHSQRQNRQQPAVSAPSDSQIWQPVPSQQRRADVPQVCPRQGLMMCCAYLHADHMTL